MSHHTTSTDWKKTLAVRPSVMLKIQRASTLEELAEVMKEAVKMGGASQKTRRKWADACERRAFVIERMKRPTPPPASP